MPPIDPKRNPALVAAPKGNPMQSCVSSARKRALLCGFALAAGIVFTTLPRPAIAAPAPLIVIDPGHGGPYSNANANGLREKTVNLQIALELRSQLVARGYRVVLTRTGDVAVTRADIPTWAWSDASGRWSYASDGHTGYVGGIPKDDLQARTDIANALGADLFISIHNNGAAGSSARGTETWASARDARGVRLSRLVQSCVVKQSGLRDRGAFTKDFYVLRWSNMPAILVEGGFITNPGDARVLGSVSGRRTIARGIADGVSAWFATIPMKPLYGRIAAHDGASLSAALAAHDFPNGAPAVVIAPAERLAEVPGAAALASSLDAPLILVPTGSGTQPLTLAVTQQLERLRPQRLIAVGPTGFPGASLLGSLAAAAGVSTSTVEVVTGADPVETSARIAGLFDPAKATVAIAAVEDPPMVALAAQAATLERIPLLLTSGPIRSPAFSSYLAQRSAPVASILVFGSPAAVPDSALAGLPGGRRVWGPSEARAAASELSRLYSARPTATLRPVIADAQDLSARLLASTHAARNGQPVVTVSGSALSPWTREWITNNRSATASFEIVAGSAPVSYLVDLMLAKADAQ